MGANSAFIPDIWTWIKNQPSFSEWRTNSLSLCICTSNSKKSTMKVSITKNSTNQPSYLTLAIIADFHMPVSLWTSSPVHLTKTDQQFLGEQDLVRLFVDMVNSALRYGPNRKTSFRLPAIQIRENFKDVFNLVFLTLVFLICIYEAPDDLRRGCVDAIKHQLMSPNAKETSKYLVWIIGPNLEEEWMRGLNLAATNWISESQTTGSFYRTPSILFSHAISASGFWKVQLYCPVIAMKMEESSSTPQDEKLAFSLKYRQVEGVVQLGYKAKLTANYIDVVVNVDNIRCDVTTLVSNTLMAERGYGSDEKHFPSRISLQITPVQQSNILSTSVTKSSDNPTHEIGFERTFEGSFEPPNAHLGLKIGANDSLVLSVKPWKFEQSARGSSVVLDWSLHDGLNGREVASTKPSKFSILQPRAWFRDRYANSYSPFTRQGGVVFARDEYGDSVNWKVCRDSASKSMQWEIRGWIWLTYWPNKQRSSYTETRCLEFAECLTLTLPKVN